MNTFAYCCESFKSSVRRASGVEPMTCPPLTAETFYPNLLSGHDFVYFDLHGEAGQPYWAGDNGLFALSAETLSRSDLGGAVVFAATCHLGDDNNPMLSALIRANASFIIAGSGTNYSGKLTVFGASLLGLWIRKLLSFGVNPSKALNIARARVMLALAVAETINDPERELVNQDTLAFKLYQGERSQETI